MSEERDYHQGEFKKEAFTLFVHYSASAKVARSLAQNLISLVMANKFLSDEQVVEYTRDGTAGINRFYEERLEEDFKSLSLAEMCVVLKQLYKIDD